MSGDARVTRATLTSQVEDAIRLDIIDGVLTPGQRLRFADLSDRYGVSATPLREALQRLAAENLIDWDPRLGATVAELSTSGLHDIYWMRELLESVALRRSIEVGDEAWRARLTDAWTRYQAAKRPDKSATRADSMAWSQTHREFHEALFAACDSPWLLRFVATLADHSERYRYLSRRTSNRNGHVEHGDIYRAAMAGDVEAGVAALRRHLASTVDAAERAILDEPMNGDAREPAAIVG